MEAAQPSLLLNTLNKTEMTDPNGARVQVFSNSDGLTILKRVELADSIGNSIVTWLETYYIYDEFGREKYTISPKGVVALQVTTPHSLDAHTNHQRSICI